MEFLFALFALPIFIPPVVTVSVLQDILTVITTVLSPCNMGKREGDAAAA